MNSETASSIVLLQDLCTQNASTQKGSTLDVGGKAWGLARLIAMGLDVPAGFVVIHAEKGIDQAELLRFYAAMGAGNVAVRSSALGEDAAGNSFAGQFETILNVKGEQALQEAVAACVASLDNERSRAYQKERGHEREASMCVVVQAMVDAAYAGVLFTADPVTGRHDRLVIDVVEGLGDALVSGEASSDHYLLDDRNAVVEKSLSSATMLLDQQQINQLADQARQAAQYMREPLDMEWAIDRSNRLFWLQARPVTTIGSDLNELDTIVAADHVLTRCNVGEILPGPVCPLTFSVQGRAIDLSLQYLHARFSGLPFIPQDELVQMAYVSGHLFINLTAGLDSSRYTLLSKAETSAQSICGRAIPELVEPSDKKSWLRRCWGIVDFIRFVSESHDLAAGFSQKIKTFNIAYQHDSQAMYRELDAKRHWLFDAGKVHMSASALSGAMEGLVQGIIARGKTPPTLEQQAAAARLFAGASDVESAVLVGQLDQVVRLIAGHPQGKSRFYDVPASEALQWINSEAAGSASVAFRYFLEQHGHRSYKELCLMEPAWVDAPEKLVESIRATLAAFYSGNPVHHYEEATVDLASQPPLIRWLLPRVHAAIRRREHTKSMLVEVTHILKRGYRQLGKLLEEEGRLPSAGLVCFFTHEELGDFIAGKRPEMAALVQKRRISFGFQQRLVFADISVGHPLPVEMANNRLEENQLAGRPVSHGVIEGIARVARNIGEAAGLQPGEILIAPVTDVGWTPYFGLIAGLATDIGSAVSHGAVIAREYGLPCVVNLQRATTVFATGDRVRLDANTGILTRLDPAGSQSSR